MPEVVYYVATSLDGYIATPEGSVDWLSTFEGTEEDYGYAEFYSTVDALLLGSRTYEQSLAFGEWAYRGKPCWVFSGRSLTPLEPNMTVTSACPVDVLSELEARSLRRAWLVGGGTLAASFRKHGFITEYIVSVIPIILGGGIPLFGGSGPRENMQLLQSRPYPNGVTQLRYARSPDL